MVTISLQNGNNVPFRVVPTQVFGSGTVDILISQPLDFENDQEYNLQVRHVSVELFILVTITRIRCYNIT